MISADDATIAFTDEVQFATPRLSGETDERDEVEAALCSPSPPSSPELPSAVSAPLNRDVMDNGDIRMDSPGSSTSRHISETPSVQMDEPVKLDHHQQERDEPADNQDESRNAMRTEGALHHPILERDFPGTFPSSEIDMASLLNITVTPAPIPAIVPIQSSSRNAVVVNMSNSEGDIEEVNPRPKAYFKSNNTRIAPSIAELDDVERKRGQLISSEPEIIHISSNPRLSMDGRSRKPTSQGKPSQPQPRPKRRSIPINDTPTSSSAPSPRQAPSIPRSSPTTMIASKSKQPEIMIVSDSDEVDHSTCPPLRMR